MKFHPAAIENYTTFSQTILDIWVIFKSAYKEFKKYFAENQQVSDKYFYTSLFPSLIKLVYTC